MNDMPNIDVLLMVSTPGIPQQSGGKRIVIWSWISCGERPIHSVATICWFSPISGMASTGTGSRGNRPFKVERHCHQPHYNKSNQKMKVKSRFSRKYLTSLLNMV
jgi:hypothetical protein